MSDKRAASHGQIRIGISGWNYPPWRGTFYPPGLPHKKELAFASRQLNSIEINGSFYSLQTPQSYHAWYQAAPEDFVFSIKGGRFITHMKRLNEIEIPLANFLASGLLALKEKLGPILWQFPPTMRFDPVRFERFMKLLPRDTSEAAMLARRHDGKVAGRALTRTDRVRPLRHAFEVRHDSFRSPEFLKMLRRHDMALVIADTPHWPHLEEMTSRDLVYIRLHGAEELYVSGYDDESLREWAARIRRFRAGGRRDVFVYFDNDAKVRAPFDAVALARILRSFEPESPMAREPEGEARARSLQARMFTHPRSQKWPSGRDIEASSPRTTPPNARTIRAPSTGQRANKNPSRR